MNENGEIVEEMEKKKQADGPSSHPKFKKPGPPHEYHPLAYRTPESGKYQYTLDYEKSMIRTSIPIIPHQFNMSKVFNVSCKYRHNENSAQTSIYEVALVVSNFQFLYLGNLSFCHEVKRFWPVQSWILDFRDKIGSFQNKIFGNI